MTVNNKQDYEDGQYDSQLGKHKTVETIKTVMADDGVEETHITHDIKRADKWKFGGWGKNYNKIDWRR